MKILSFDQAAKVSGWSYWEDNQPKEWGIVEPSPKSAKGGVRLSSLRRQFKKLITHFSPDIVLIEDPVGGEEDSGPANNWKTMQILCQVQGVLLQLIDECDCSVEIISPSSWQFTCGIHKRDRASRKAGAKEFVKNYYHIDEPLQDAVDSMCIAHHYVESNNQEQRSVF